MSRVSAKRREPRTGHEPVIPSSQLIGNLTWSEIAGSGIRRLKRGKHWRGDAGAFQREANEAAAQMDMAVRTLRDQFNRKLQYVWVEFADGYIPAGNPCPCGHDTLERVHRHFVHCAECGRDLILRGADDAIELEEEDEDDDQELVDLEDTDGRSDAERFAALQKLPRNERRKAALRLDAWRDVRLALYDRDLSRERYRGVGYDLGGNQALILVDFALDEDGHRIPDRDDQGRHAHRVSFLPLGPFAHAIDVDAVLSNTGFAETADVGTPEPPAPMEPLS
jgi:hypothetical protein